jgi:hypothetical protein
VPAETDPNLGLATKMPIRVVIDRGKLARVTMETHDPYKKRESETVYTFNLFRKGTG